MPMQGYSIMFILFFKCIITVRRNISQNYIIYINIIQFIKLKYFSLYTVNVIY